MRRSVVAAATLVLALALALAAMLLRSELRHALEQSITDQTVTRAQAVAELVATGDVARVIEPSERAPGWVQVVDEDGTVYAGTANVARFSEPIAPLVAVTNGGVVRRMSGLSIDPADLIVVAYTPTKVEGKPGIVLAAAPLDLADATDRRVTTVLLTVFPLLLGIAASIIWVATRRALRPVEAIRQQMSSIAATTDLARRVPQPASNDEVARLAATVNATLDRLDRSSARQRRFVADASHELRSPLASLRNQLEASMIGATDNEWIATAQDMVIDHDRLERLVGDLLVLARHDEGERRIQEPLDLGHLVRSEAKKGAAIAGIDVEVDAQNALINGNEADLVRVIRNLLDNAARHASATINVGVTAHDNTVELRVSNDGGSIPELELSRIFERFHRLDDARSTDAGGSGLGLAIVKELVTAHDGTVVAEPVPSGASFLITFPTLAS